MSFTDVTKMEFTFNIWVVINLLPSQSMQLILFLEDGSDEYLSDFLGR